MVMLTDLAKKEKLLPLPEVAAFLETIPGNSDLH